MSKPTPDEPAPKIIRVVINARVKEDAADLIRQVREALKASGLRLRVDTYPDAPSEVATPEASTSVTPVSRDPAMEAAINKLAAAALEDKAREIAKGATTPKPDPDKAAEIKKSLWKWLGEKAKVGWKVTVEAGLEWVKKQVG